MCSIAGFTWDDRALGERMNEVQKHRGPDGSGVWSESGITLVHNRLAILDPRAIADQPMKSADERYTLIYNGEIYNFKKLRSELSSYSFQTTGDTEVLLAGFATWGNAVFAKLDGMFACAIWDTKTKTLTLARDSVGIKPLYYTECEKGLAFASEAKALYQLVTPTLERDAFALYMRLLYVPGPNTLVSGIHTLPPGSVGEWKEGNLAVTKIMTSTAPEASFTSFDTARDQVRQIVEQSVLDQLVSDKPLGVYLSGGIDSTVVTLAALKERSELDTFTTGFQVPERDYEKFNADFLLARETARLLGTKHHEVMLDAKELPELYEKTQWHLDQPIANMTSVSQFVLASYAKETVDVVLGGDGGDELFGGYQRHRLAYAARRFQQLPNALQSLLSLYPKADKLRTPTGPSLYALFHCQNDDVLERFLAPAWQNSGQVDALLKPLLSQRHEYERFMMENDERLWLVDESLARSDKLGMAHGLEQRVPLLGNDVVALAHQLPRHYLLNMRESKKILKAAFADDLPSHILHAPKRGWFTPGAKWFRIPAMQEYLKNVLSKEYNQATGELFDFNALSQMLEDHIEGRAYHYTPLLAVLAFQVWARTFGIKC